MRFREKTGAGLLASMLVASLVVTGCVRTVSNRPTVEGENPCTLACDADLDDCRRARGGGSALMAPWIVVGIAGMAAGVLLAVLGLAAGSSGCGGGTCSPSVGGGSKGGKNRPICEEARSICLRRCDA